jgi:hypothetical protein
MEVFINFISTIIAHASWEMAGNLFSLLIMLSMVIVVWRWHSAQSNPVNLADILLDDNGKLGSSKMRINGAWLLFSWVIVYMTLNKNLTEWLVAIYIAAFVADRINSRKNALPPPDVKHVDPVMEEK